ncbi:MAG: hypothetical protein U1E51_12580 [Candidatus Binatia bacterium]|nr:hypothetical protein [Candidatus Binatia bacterium]
MCLTAGLMLMLSMGPAVSAQVSSADGVQAASADAGTPTPCDQVSPCHQITTMHAVILTAGAIGMAILTGPVGLAVIAGMVTAGNQRPTAGDER